MPLKTLTEASEKLGDSVFSFSDLDSWRPSYKYSPISYTGKPKSFNLFFCVFVPHKYANPVHSDTKWRFTSVQTLEPWKVRNEHKIFKFSLKLVYKNTFS